MGDGTFWVSDEYGPFLIHFDRNGVTLEQNSPCSGPNQLPAALIRRQPNKGMEGLASIEGGNTLVGIVQNPLDNPPGTVKASKSNLLRIVFVDTKKHTTKTYLYPMDDPGFGASEIESVSNTTFLVDERDGKFINDAVGESVDGEEDLPDRHQRRDGRERPGERSQSGLVIGGKTIEQMKPADLAANNIKPVTKTLIVDMLQWGYPHDKAEGLVLFKDGQTIGVSNDDDFGVTDDGAKHQIQKIFRLTGRWITTSCGSSISAGIEVDSLEVDRWTGGPVDRLTGCPPDYDDRVSRLGHTRRETRTCREFSFSDPLVS